MELSSSIKASCAVVWPFKSAIVFAILAGAFVVLRTYPIYDTDDAYITYRYAQNIAEHGHFRFNLNEAIIGTTTPLYTLLLAALHLIGIDIPSASHLISNVCVTLTLTLIYLVSAALWQSLVVGILAALLSFLFPEYLLYSSSGMETALYVILITTTILCYSRNHLVSAAVLAGLCAITRLDGLAVGAALFIHYVVTNRTLPKYSVFIGLFAVLVPWFIFSYFATGTILPHSMIAKGQHVLTADRYWMPLFFVTHYYMAFALPLIIFGAYLASSYGQCREMKSFARVLAIWSVLYVSAYTIYRIDLYRWYLAPLTLPIGVFTASTVGFLISEMRQGKGAQKLGAVVTILPLTLLLAVLFGSEGSRQWNAYVEWTNGVEGARYKAAQVITNEGQQDDIICSGQIGVLGWFSGRYIWDALGLVTDTKIGYCPPNTKWRITETSHLTEESKFIPAFEFIKAFPSIESGPTFLLFKHEVAPAFITTHPFAWTNGIEALQVSVGSTFLVKMRITKKIEKPLKLFVHLKNDAGDVLAFRDFYPSPEIDKMNIGEIYTLGSNLNGTKPDSVTSIVFGFFDEADPNWARVPLTTGEDGVTIKLEK